MRIQGAPETLSALDLRGLGYIKLRGWYTSYDNELGLSTLSHTGDCVPWELRILGTCLQGLSPPLDRTLL